LPGNLLGARDQPATRVLLAAVPTGGCGSGDSDPDPWTLDHQDDPAAPITGQLSIATLIGMILGRVHKRLI